MVSEVVVLVVMLTALVFSVVAIARAAIRKDRDGVIDAQILLMITMIALLVLTVLLDPMMTNLEDARRAAANHTFLAP